MASRAVERAATPDGGREFIAPALVGGAERIEVREFLS